MNFFSRVYQSLSPIGWASLVFLILFGWFWIFGNKGLVELETLKQQRTTLSTEEKTIASENEKLKLEIEKLKDPRYQRHLIHRDLGYVESDELLIMIDPNP